MSKSILHIGGDTFLPPFIEFVKEHFDFNQHQFFITGGVAEHEIKSYPNLKLGKKGKVNRIIDYLQLIIPMHQSKKIIMHGLFNWHVVVILFFMPWLLRKCYWVMWGGDLYVHQLGKKNWQWKISEFFRRPVIKNIAVFTTTVPGDYDLAKEWYGIKSKFIHNLMYSSHLSRDGGAIICTEEKDEHVYIQVGNSSDPGNNHEEILNYLSKFKEEKIKVFCPLSYGSESHRDKILKKGRELLGDKFYPMTELLSFAEYNKYMACIDVAIFNHDRQQAMGNIIGLLSLGKKVVLKNTVTPFRFFVSLGVKVETIGGGDLLKPLDLNDMNHNKEIMKNYFTKERLISNWKDVFND